MTKFVAGSRRRGIRRVLLGLAGIAALMVVMGLIGTAVAYHNYHDSLRPLDTDTTTYNIVVATGSTPADIAGQLKSAHLIRSASAMEWYIRLHRLGSKLQAGTYAISSSSSIQQIVAQIAHGQIVKNLVIILPEQRLDQIKDSFLNAKFPETSIEQAFEPEQYADISVLSDKPTGASLEGYLFPDTFQKGPDSSAASIVRQSLIEMDQHVTPELRTAYAKEGLSVYQAITLASIVEQEVSRASDRPTVAQVFLKRLQTGMPLGSDVTLFYARKIGDERYDTTVNKGLPPGPISNVTDTSLQAVAHPANTDYLYFVSGDDGNTYFSHTLAEHQALTRQYCHKLCGQ